MKHLEYTLSNNRESGNRDSGLGKIWVGLEDHDPGWHGDPQVIKSYIATKTH